MDIRLKSESVGDYDVVVLGGGPSGCTAAAAAAREGAKTLLVEKEYCLGGMGTSALVPVWCPFSDREKFIYGGMAHDFLVASRKMVPHIDKDQLDWIPINAEHVKRLYDDLVERHGASVLFGAMFLSANLDAANESIDSVNLVTKGGVFTVSAKTFIDCTGDADLAVASGVEFSKGEKETGALQPATHCFSLSNVDMYGYISTNKNNPFHSDNKNSVIYKILDSGKYPEITEQHFNPTISAPGMVSINAGHIFDVDGTDPFSVSKAMIIGRKLIKAYRDALAEFCPVAFANCVIAKTGSVMGIRESRRIHGDYVLTLDDYLERRSFHDEICRNSYYIDIHMAQKEIQEKEAQGKPVKIPRYGPGESHGIPYRCLIPKGQNNLLVAGRSISVDREVLGSIRVMPVCLSMGEAAGTAAAMALEAEGRVRSVDTDVLRDKLKNNGAYLPDLSGQAAHV